MRTVHLFEASGVIRDAFAACGHDAMSVDFRPTQRPGRHWQGDVFEFLRGPEFAAANLVTLNYTCTYLCGSGLHWNHRVPGRHMLTLRALHEARSLIEAMSGKLWAFENPVGLIGTQIMPAFDTFQPYEFGDDASKRTCLYGNLPKLRRDPAARRPGRWVTDPKSGKTVERWGNQTDGGQNKLAPSADRWALRSETYPGAARAMAEQWGAPAEQFGFDWKAAA